MLAFMGMNVNGTMDDLGNSPRLKGNFTGTPRELNSFGIAFILVHFVFTGILNFW